MEDTRATKAEIISIVREVATVILSHVVDERVASIQLETTDGGSIQKYKASGGAISKTERKQLLCHTANRSPIRNTRLIINLLKYIKRKRESN